MFCSNVYQENWAQQFKIIFIHFLGNAVKMCSNFSYLIFSLNRSTYTEKTLKKKIQTETNKNKELDDEDVSNVRETMLSFLQDSKSSFYKIVNLAGF